MMKPKKCERILPGLRTLIAPVFAAFALPAGAAAQTALGTPDAVFPEDFGAIQTVRELPDMRVLVADPLGRALFVVDMEDGTRTTVGQLGQGPREYEQPDAVWPLPADSTLLVDLGNGRLVVLGPDLGFGRTMPIAAGDPREGASFQLAIPQGVDGGGRIYSRSLGMGGGPDGALPDSGAVLRIDRTSRAADTVATVKLQHRARNTSGGATERNVQIENVPLSPEDAWGVASDGTVVVARTGDYHVEWIDPSGRITRGPPVPYEPVRIGTPEKEEWLLEAGRGGGAIGVQMMVQNGVVSTTFSRGGGAPGGAGASPGIDAYVWPEYKPAFHGGRIGIDARGRAWVHRHTEAGAPTTYDVFDGSGARLSTVTLEPGKRVVGFGREHVYVVSFDELDLSYLERYRLP